MNEEKLLPVVISVDRPPPPELTSSEIGVGLFGPPDSLYLVFREEFRDDEVDAIRDGRYRVAVKLFQGGGVAGLVWRILASGSDMIGFANYSLRHLRDRVGDEAAEDCKRRARDSSFAGSPWRGLLLSLVFVDPGTGLVFALRAFTLPRLFSDRFLRAILATEDQDTAKTDAILAKLFEAGSAVWSMARPGIAVAGEESELDEADFVRLLRSDRNRRARP